MLLFMNCLASQPAMPPMMMGAIQPTPASPIISSQRRNVRLSLHVAPWIDQRINDELAMLLFLP